MPKTSSAEPFAIKWGYGMTTTVIAFKPDDCVAVLEALGIRRMPRTWVCGDMRVVSLSGSATAILFDLEKAGISFNYAAFPVKDSMSANARGQVRYGHDGTVMRSNLVPDVGLAGLYSQSLPGESVIDDTTRYRICYVCCGQESWDNREEHGQMHKLRNLLSE